MDKTLAKRWIAVDPGRSKCGYARFEQGQFCERGIVTPEELASWLQREMFPVVVVGDRTGAERLLRQVYPKGPSTESIVYLVDEDRSSQEGRKRFLAYNRRGWRRFWPLSLQSPWEPYDDFVAEVLAERFLSNSFSVRRWGDKKLPGDNPKKDDR